MNTMRTPRQFIRRQLRLQGLLPYPRGTKTRTATGLVLNLDGRFGNLRAPNPSLPGPGRRSRYKHAENYKKKEARQ